MRIKRTGRLALKRGRWYFLHQAPDGRVVWQALYTTDRAEAARRAARISGAALLAGDRAQWLQSLVELGRWASLELQGEGRAELAQTLAWSDLFERWRRANPKLTRHAPTLRCYEFSVDALARWAEKAGARSPAAVTRDLAQEWAGKVSVKSVDVLRRLWRDVGLEPVWPERTEEARGTRYRRLSAEEVRAAVRLLRTGRPGTGTGKASRKGQIVAVPDVADLVVIGWHTGLRRADVATLTREQVAGSGDFLRVTPGKTEGSKGVELLIPLQEEARKTVARLLEAAGPEPDAPLFPRLAEAALSKCLRQAWRTAGVKATSAGRASFHSLRASFISAMDEAGVPPHVTDAITGHAAGGMHARYTQPGREALMAAVVKAIAPIETGAIAGRGTLPG